MEVVFLTTQKISLLCLPILTLNNRKESVRFSFLFYDGSKAVARLEVVS